MARRADARRLAAPALLVALLLTGCSGGAAPTPITTPTNLDLSDEWGDDVGNGVALLGTADARAAVIDAMRGRGAVSMSGTFVDAAGRRLTLSVVAGAGGSVGEFAAAEQTTRVALVDDVAYVLPSAAIAAANGLRPDVYSCVAVDDPMMAAWGPLLDPVQTVADLTADASGIAPAGAGTANLVLGTEGTLGTLLLSAEGDPVPLRLVRSDATGTVDLTFEDGGEVDAAKPTPLAQDC